MQCFPSPPAILFISSSLNSPAAAAEVDKSGMRSSMFAMRSSCFVPGFLLMCRGSGVRTSCCEYRLFSSNKLCSGAQDRQIRHGPGNPRVIRSTPSPRASQWRDAIRIGDLCRHAAALSGIRDDLWATHTGRRTLFAKPSAAWAYRASRERPHHRRQHTRHAAGQRAGAPFEMHAIAMHAWCGNA